MTTQRSKQAGFSIVETLLLIILVLLIGFIGYYVYSANNKTSDTYNTANDSATPLASNKKSAATAKNGTETSETAVIQQAVLKFGSNASVNNPTVSVLQTNGTYAVGTIADSKSSNSSTLGDPVKGYQAIWFAVKTSNSWAVTTQTVDTGDGNICTALTDHGLDAWADQEKQTVIACN